MTTFMQCYWSVALSSRKYGEACDQRCTLAPVIWIWLRVIPILAAFAGIVLSPASADLPQGRSADIKAILEKIGGNDPIERVLAVQEALASEDPFLRSLVVEKALLSDDRRVKATAFGYLIGQQKRFVVEVAVQDKALEDLKDKRTIAVARAMQLTTIDIREYEKGTQQFDGVATGIGKIKGAIAQDGLTMIPDVYPECKLQFPGAIPGYLIGSFSCGNNSFVAKSALP